MLLVLPHKSDRYRLRIGTDPYFFCSTIPSMLISVVFR